MLGIDFPQAFQHEGRSGAVPQQTSQPLAIVSFDEHAGIEREALTVLPGTHGLRAFALDQSAPGECPQKTHPDLGRNCGHHFATEVWAA